MSGAAHPAVSLDNVSKRFGRFQALARVSGEFDAGRMYAVLGDNGAGKSTLLRIVAGLAQTTSGIVSVFGAPPARQRAVLGYMGHASMLYDELDAVENLTYFATLYGFHDKTRCVRAIEQVGLDPALKRPVGQYSQGMRQRLSLARAVVHEPKLLLLDEPFSNVDAASAREMAAILGGMRDRGRTVFVVTHQPALLDGIADEFVTLAGGALAQRTPRNQDLPHEVAR